MRGLSTGDRAHALQALTLTRRVAQVPEDQAWEIFSRAEGTAARNASRWLIDGDHDRAMSWARAAEYLRRQVLLSLSGWTTEVTDGD